MENTKLKLVVKFDLTSGNVDSFISMARDISGVVESSEPLTESYEWYKSDDGESCYVVENYPTSDALLEHLNNIGEALGPLLELGSISEMLVFGSPNDSAREVLSGFGAKFFQVAAGFAR